MFFNLLRFEIKDRLFRVSSLVYFLVYLALSFLIGFIFGGAIKGATVGFGLSNKLALNSPVVLNTMTTFLAYLGLLIVAPVFGQSINKDFENKFSQILFATPLSKRNYFFSRYLGSAISSVSILSAISIGIWLATLMPFIDQTLVQDQHLSYYLAPYLTNVIPNILIFGAIYISVVSIWKKMAPVYVASIAVFTGWMISQTLTHNLENKFVAAMIEPFGMEGASQVTRYWSVTEQASRVIPLTGVLLQNRLLWGAVGFLFLVFAYLSFNPFRLPKEKAAKKTDLAVGPSVYARFSPIELPKVELSPDSFKVLWGLAVSEFKQAFSNLYFLMILLCGVIYLFAISGEANKIYGTETLPVTYMVLEVIGGNFGLFVMILTTFYAGDLVWKDKERHFYELVDSKPISNFHLYISKLLSLVLLQFFLLFVIFVCSILIQTFKGYHHYELGVYFESLLVYHLPARMFVCVLALFIQTLSKNKYVGHSILIFYYVMMIWLPGLGLDHHLYLIGETPFAEYSDMNGFGTSFYRFFSVAVYWSFLFLGLSVLTVLFWRRGVEQSFKQNWDEMKRRLRPVHRNLLLFSGTGFVLMGAFIYYNTNVLNPYVTQRESEQRRVDYERAYKSFETLPQPTTIAVKLDADLWPEHQKLVVKGKLTLQNQSNTPVEKILISNENEDLKLDSLIWSKPATLTEENKRLRTRIFKLATPLQPKEKIDLDYVSRIEPRGFTNDDFSKEIVQNGTFINNFAMGPKIGYSREREISENKTRRKYDLGDRPRMHSIHDKDSYQHSYLNRDGNWIEFEATVRTAPDQIAVAPGYLESESMVDGRRVFRYKMDRPILNFYSILSARYQVTRDEWNGVKIEIYSHPGHDTNNARMIESVKKSLDYYSTNFTPYQFRQFRILEFPRYESFAQSFPNTVPYSESVGFIAKVNSSDPESIDYPFYITSHELAHQWWGHQVVGADVQGSTMLSESLAEYSALRVQEKEYGPKQMKKFYKYILDRYLAGRSRETKQELPLELNEGQTYIHYNKGSLVFMALQDFLGEKLVNGVLKQFLQDYAFKGPAFPTSIDLVDRLRKAAPSELAYLIPDLFEDITFYDNRTESVTYRKEGNQYRVTIKGESRKYRTDGLGKETEVGMHEGLDVGVYNLKGELIYLKKHDFKSGKNTVEVIVGEVPKQAGIDPLNKMIDRVSDDNVAKAQPLQ